MDVIKEANKIISELPVVDKLDPEEVKEIESIYAYEVTLEMDMDKVRGLLAAYRKVNADWWNKIIIKYNLIPGQRYYYDSLTKTIRE
jgi:hypothetical protein